MAVLFLGGSARAGTYDVLTRNYNNQRTGATLVEPTLTTANVNAAQFGFQFSVYADDQIYGQILVRQGLSIPGQGVHDVLFVTTVTGAVWAYDADYGDYLWAWSYIPAGQQATQESDDCNNGGNFTQYNSLVGTPVIDPSTNIMYFIVRSKSGSNFYEYLHGIDITTGNDLFSPTQIVGSLDNVSFDPRVENQRAALTLSNGYVYANWGSHCDQNTWHGWTMAFNASNLLQEGIMVTSEGNTDNTSKAGIWQGGGGMAVDADGSLFAATGNGTILTTLGFSLIKLDWPSLALEDSFTSSMLDGDMDFGSSGPVLLPPNFDLATVGAKDGYVYVTNTTGLGGYVQGDTQIVQRLQAVQSQGSGDSEILGSNVAWVGPDGYTYLYVWGDNDYLRRYRFDPSINEFDQPASDVGAVVPTGLPAGTMSLSSYAAISGTGILWATTPADDSGGGLGGTGVLRAFNAENLALLWQSTDSWNYAKFNPPVVSNGRVYVPTFSNAVNVYSIIQNSPVTSGQISILRQRNSMYPGICVDAGGVTTEVTNLQVNSCNGGNAQAWQFNQTGSGFYSWQITRPGSGMCMDVPGGDVFNGQVVQQSPCNNSPEQSFGVSSAQDGLQIMFGGYCVTLPPTDSSPGALLQLSVCTGGIVATDSQVLTALPSQIRMNDSGLPGVCVDVPWGTQSPGQQLQIYTCNAQENQSWQSFWYSDGTQGIVRNGTNLCFDIPYGDGHSGQIVQQYTCNGGSSQKFYLEPAWHGYQIRFANDQNVCVATPSDSNGPNSDTPNTLLQLLPCNPTVPQASFSLFQPQLRKATSGTAPGLCLTANFFMNMMPCNGLSNQDWMAQSNMTITNSLGTIGIVGAGGQTQPYSGEPLSPDVYFPPTPPGQFQPSNQWWIEPYASTGEEIYLAGTGQPGYCVDSPWGWNTVQNVQIYSCNQTVSQQFAQ